jgi:(2Fe-2S) ferredoxin
VLTRGDVDEVLDVHLGRGGRVERLMLQPEDEAPPPGRGA